MDPVAKTAYYCCGVRAADAARPNPICGDYLAQRFMNPEAREIVARFQRFRGPNASNVTRHRLIDDWLRERLKATPDLRIVLLGAGFDTRAFRLMGGRWLELDQAAIVAAKEAELPAHDAPNSLQRVAIDFASEALADKLKPWAGESPTLVVLEGVAVYLKQAELRAMLDTLVRCFPGHVLISDIMTARFLRRYSRSMFRALAELGAHYGDLFDDPTAVVADAGYRKLVQVSIIDRARELGALPIPRVILNTVLRGVRDGYSAYVFEAIK